MTNNFETSDCEMYDPTAVKEEEQDDESDREWTYEHYMDYLTEEKIKLPEQEETCVDSLLKLYIDWCKTLEKDVPVGEYRSRLIRCTQETITSLSNFREKINSGFYLQEPYVKQYNEDVGKELDKFEIAIYGQMRFRDTPGFGHEIVTTVPPVVEDGDSAKSTFIEKTHEQFLIDLTTIENTLPREAVFAESLKLFIGWVRELEGIFLIDHSD